MLKLQTLTDDQVSNIKQEITKENQLQNNTSSVITERSKEEKII